MRKEEALQIAEKLDRMLEAGYPIRDIRKTKDWKHLKSYLVQRDRRNETK